MNRGKVGPTRAAARARDLLAKFAKRKEAVRGKARELASRCDIDVAVVCTDPGGAGDLDCWPSKEVASEVFRRYGALSPEHRAKHTEDLAAVVARELAEERDKLVRAREGGPLMALGSRDGTLEGMSEHKLRELLAAIECSQVDAKKRILMLQTPLAGAVDHATLSRGLVHEDEATVEDSVSATGDGVPPRGEAAASGGGLGLPPTKNPNSPNAAMPVGKEVVAAENDGGEVQMLQPPGDADADADAEWMRGLVDDLKRSPQPYDPAEYAANVGWFVMERDAYDSIRFDLGMPPPCIAPIDDDNDGGGGEPLKLWSWDNTMPPP